MSHTPPRTIVLRAIGIIAAAFVTGLAYTAASKVPSHTDGDANGHHNEPVPVQVADPAAGKTPTAVTWEEAKLLVDNSAAVLVDVRLRTVYEAGTIPGAVSLPLKDMKEEMPGFLGKYDTNTVIIVFCSDPGCATSETAAKTLMNDYGYENVLDMPGGYDEWRKAQAASQSRDPKKGTNK